MFDTHEDCDLRTVTHHVILCLSDCSNAELKLTALGGIFVEEYSVLYGFPYPRTKTGLVVHEVHVFQARS